MTLGPEHPIIETQDVSDSVLPSSRWGAVDSAHSEWPPSPCAETVVLTPPAGWNRSHAPSAGAAIA